VRVALVRQRYDPSGGAERFIERALPALERAGIEPTLIARQAKGWGARRTMTVNPPYLGSAWRDASFARAARAAWEAERFDLVQSHERIAGCDIYRAGDGVHAQWLEIRRAAAGAAERLGIALNPHHRYLCEAERQLFSHPKLRAVVCNSAMVRDEIHGRFGVAAGKLHVIHNGVDLERFHPRNRAKGTEGETVFLFVGSGFARKGLDAAIRALGQCADESFRLVVAGRDRNLERYARLARETGAGGRVQFVGERDDVRPLYAAADCFILPTRYDPFPNTALEALATGLPVIVGRRSGAAEIVQAASNGWVCRPEDPEELAALMRAAAAKLRDKNTGRALRTAARESAEKYGIDDMARRLTALYLALA
jgi:UDP-glucose:(heptosyl)LPS alpha-1,3-glucosyltransferase